jgi:hypothetical protein
MIWLERHQMSWPCPFTQTSFSIEEAAHNHWNLEVKAQLAKCKMLKNTRVPRTKTNDKFKLCKHVQRLLVFIPVVQFSNFQANAAAQIMTPLSGLKNK